MAEIPVPVAAFLGGRRFAVAGVSRDPQQAANAIYRKLRGAGYEVFPVNPKAAEVEGVKCFADLASVPGSLDGVVIATPPGVAAAVVRQAAEKGVPRVWLHRSFGTGSVSPEAVQEAAARGVECLEGGCPLMYSAPVDLGHRCMRWWLARKGRVPK
ncbi:MAG TPA: CoA-binding protein [Thermoanaerobaculia bacterium]|nr:CoA-binding protein [Thermoanaerobaculia bacterium]